jgi:hypothetical protein
LCPENAGEVHSESGQVDRHVRHRLAGIEHDERARRRAPAHQFRTSATAPVTFD